MYAVQLNVVVTGGANVLAMTTKTSDRIFNICTGVETSINQIVKHLRSTVRSSVKTKDGPSKPVEKRCSIIDSYREKVILDWRHNTYLLEGQRNTCEYFKQFKS